MRVTVGKEDMLALWRRHVAAEPERSDCHVERSDAIDLDARLSREMRSWYLRLLDTAPEELLAPTDLSVKAQVHTVGHITSVRAPEGCRRVLRVKFGGWLQSVAVAAERPAHGGNPLCRRPMVWRVSAREIAVTGATGVLSLLECAYDSGEEEYTFDDRAICENL